MPFKSKRQQRKFFAMEHSGEIPKGTAMRWAEETPNIKKLPEKKKTASLCAPELERTLFEGVLSKEAGMEGILGGLGSKLAPVLLPAGLGAYAAGPEHRMEGAIGGAALGAVGKRLAPELMRKAMFTSPRQLGLAQRHAGRHIPEGSRAYKKLHKALGEETPGFVENLMRHQKNIPNAEWGGRALGGLGGGLAAKELLGDTRSSLQAPYIQAQPTVSDMRTQYYSGLTPDEGMYY